MLISKDPCCALVDCKKGLNCGYHSMVSLLSVQNICKGSMFLAFFCFTFFFVLFCDAQWVLLFLPGSEYELAKIWKKNTTE